MARHLTQPSSPLPTPAEWRAAMGYFPTGVTVVTSWDGDRPVGSTISAFCSVSLEPPMLLVCLANDNPVRGPAAESGVIGVNMLGCEGGELAMRFADPALKERFEGLDWSAAEAGAPQLKAAPVFVDCAVEAIWDAGDHVVVVARGLRTEHTSQAAPLLYHRGRFPTFDPGA